MKRIKGLAAAGAMLVGLFLATSSYGGAQGAMPIQQNPNRCEATKSLFVNITSGRVQRISVAFLVAQANLQAIGADVNLFLADEAAILAVNSDYWPEEVTGEEKTALLCLQQKQEGVVCPELPTLAGLLNAGARAYGCPLCVQEVVKDKMSIFDDDGNVDMGKWAEVIFDDIPPITPFDFELIYDRDTKRPRCHIDASVMSF